MKKGFGRKQSLTTPEYVITAWQLRKARIRTMNWKKC